VPRTSCFVLGLDQAEFGQEATDALHPDSTSLIK
jgi:hypothetical protein